MRLSQEAIQRMIDGRSGGGGGGGSFDPSALAGYATQAWTEENYISKTFFNELFVIHKKVTTVVMDGDTEISRTVTTNSVFAPNEIPGTTTETDEETGYVTTVTTEISSIESKKGFWTNYFISALGLNSEGGGGGATLFEPLLSINESGLAAPTDAQDGMTVVWDKNTHKWKYGATGGGSGEYLPLTGGTLTGNLSIKGAHDLSFANNGITDSNRRYYGYYIKDANNKRSAQYINTVSPDGNNAFWMSVTYGFDQTTGIEQDKGFGLTVDKQGNCTWSVSDPAAFRTAIGVNFDNFVTINTDQTITGKKTFTRDIVLTNNQAINFKNTSDAEYNILSFNSSDNLVLGWGVRNTSENYICGKTIQMAVYDATDINTVRSVFFANNAGNVVIGTMSPYTKLDVDGGVKATKFYLYKPNANNDTGAVYFQYVSGQSGVQLVGAGFFTESYVSALGANSAGGGGGVSSLSELSDVQLSSPSNGQALIYDSTIGKWRNGAAGMNVSELTTYLTSKILTIKNGTATLGTWNPTAAGVIDIASAVSGYLPLTGGSLTGNLNIVYSHDLSKSNNGVSDTLWPGYRIFDKDGRRSAQFVNGVYSSGSNFVWMSISNYDTNGNMIADYGIGLSVDKNGAGTWSVSEPAAFRTAIDALSKTEINGYTWWGRALSNGVVNGDMSNVGNISFSASGKNIGGLMSFVTAGNGTVGVGTLSPNTNYKLDVNGYTKTSRLYLSDTIYMVVQNDGIHIVGGGLYADTYVSALGLSDSGGSAFDETAMWQALGTNITDKDIALAYIQTAADTRYALKTDIPTLSNLSWSYGSVTAASGNSYNGSAARSFIIPKNTSHLVNDSGFVTSSALGSYLPLSGGTLTGNLNIKYSHDLSKSNNGVSDTLWPGYRTYDKDGRRSAQFVNGVYSSGSNFVWMSISNYDTSGNMIADYGIGLSVDKNGVGTWSVSEPAAFRTAIGITSLLNGYLPLTGGILSGQLSFSYSNSEKLILYANNEGGNIRIVSPSNYTDEDGNQRFWEMDAYNGNLRFYSRNNGATWVNFRTDGSVYSSAQGKLWGEDNDGSGSGLDADTLDGLHASQLQTAFQYNAGGTGGSVGWVKVARITIGGSWTNQPLIFKVAQRGRNGATLTLRFTNVGTISDARVDNFTYNGDMDTATIVNVTSGSVWDLYIRKTEAYDSIGISQIDKGANIASINVTWTNEQAASVPTGVNDGANDRTAVFDNPASNLKTAVNIWGNSFNGTSDINGNLIMPNSRGIVIKDTNGVEQNVFVYNQNNDIVIGWGPRATSDTFITGNTINIARNGGTSAIYVNTSNNVGIGGSTGDSTYKLTVAGAAKVNELWIGNIRITASAEGIHIANGGLSANTYVSALGVGDQGGGGGADLETVWNSMAENDSSHYIHISHIQSALSSYLSSNNYITSSSITDMATMTWVGQQGYITSSALTGYATQQWVTNQGYVTNAGVTSVDMSVPTGLRVNSAASATITGTGTFALTFTSGYSIPTTAKQSNWDTAYGWGNHASAGYATPSSVATQMQSYAYISGNVIHIGDSSITPLTNHQSVDGTFWGRSWSNHGTVSGSIEAGNSGGYIGGFDHIDLNTHASLLGYGGYIDFYYEGANSYTSRIIEEDSGLLALRSPYTLGLLVGGYNGDYVQIGQIRIVYDYSNNALKVMHSNGGAANLYAMGGISALGMSGNASGEVGGSLIPAVNGSYALGSANKGWTEICLNDGDSATLNIYADSGEAWYSCSGKHNFEEPISVNGYGYFNGTGYFRDKLSIGGTNSNGTKLYVSASSATELCAYFYGNASANTFTSRSDMRLKDFVENINLSVESIAAAPSFKYTFKGDSRLMAGTSAQYWRGVLSEVVFEDADTMLSLDYGVTALVSVISVARKVMTHEERIAALEAENERLRNEIETLKAA